MNHCPLTMSTVEGSAYSVISRQGLHQALKTIKAHSVSTQEWRWRRLVRSSVLFWR